MDIRLGQVVAAWCAAVASIAATPPPNVNSSRNLDLAPLARIRVVVYRSASDLAVPELWTALDVASDVLAMASVGVAWSVCDPGECPIPEPAALKVRILQSANDGGGETRRRLGDALIDRRTKRGVLATVFVDRTRRLAGDLGIDHQGLLGHTIAHELGHLLLATTTHAKAGLMRETWSREELRGARGVDWTFAPREVAAIRARLASLQPDPWVDEGVHEVDQQVRRHHEHG